MVDRRQVLRGLAAGAGALGGLAGCLGGGGCSEGRTVHETSLSLPDDARWPTARYDAGNTGYNPDARVPAEDARVAWRHSACTPTEAGVAIGHGNVYGEHRVVNAETGTARDGPITGPTPTLGGALYVGGADLRAYDPTTGDARWTFPTDGDGPLPSPTVAEGTVYVPGGVDDPTLYAVDSETGTER